MSVLLGLEMDNTGGAKGQVLLFELWLLVIFSNWATESRIVCLIGFQTQIIRKCQ